MSIHEGHRQRMKDRYRKDGLDRFDQHQVLELLLYYCVPRVDTNPIAHALLDRFETVDKVLQASPTELMKVPGVGENAAYFLSMLNDLERYRYAQRQTRPVILNTLDECGAYLVNQYINRRNETVLILCLDAKCKLIGCFEVGEGSVNSAAVPVRRLVEMALAVNATSIVLAHNHPSGIAVPSDEDVHTTRRVAMALSAVEIALADHIIVAEDDYVSLAQSGLYNPQDALSML